MSIENLPIGSNNDEHSREHMWPSLTHAIAAGVVTVTLAGGSKPAEADSVPSQLDLRDDAAVASLVEDLTQGFRGSEDELFGHFAPELRAMCYESTKEWSLLLVQRQDGTWHLEAANKGETDHVAGDVVSKDPNGATRLHIHNHSLEASRNSAFDPQLKEFRAAHGLGDYTAALMDHAQTAYRTDEVVVPHFPPSFNDLAALRQGTDNATRTGHTLEGAVAECNGVWTYERTPMADRAHSTPIDPSDAAHKAIREAYVRTELTMLAPYSVAAWNAYFEHGDRSIIEKERVAKDALVPTLTNYAQELGYTVRFRSYNELLPHEDEQ
jgi:hypothetical protein